MCRWREVTARLGFGCDGLWSGDFAVGALDAGSFALEIAEVIEAGATDLAFANDFDGADRRRMEREDAVNAHAKDNPADRGGGAGGAAFLRDDHAFKSLKAFLFLIAFALFEADVHADGIAGAEVRKIGAQLRVVQFLDNR